MQCAQIQKSLPEYAVDGLSPRVREAVAAHLDGCAACRQELAALERTATLLEALPRPEVPTEVWERVAAATVDRPRRTLPWWGPVATGAGLAAALLVMLLRPHAPTAVPSTPVAEGYAVEYRTVHLQTPLADRAATGLWLVEGR